MEYMLKSYGIGTRKGNYSYHLIPIFNNIIDMLSSKSLLFIRFINLESNLYQSLHFIVKLFLHINKASANQLVKQSFTQLCDIVTIF